MKRKTIYRIISIVAAILFVICAVMLIKIYLPESSYREEYTNEAASDSSGSQLVENPIDFDKLQNTNPDVYAWIEIPDTNIDYAIAQSGEGEDDLFYLDHNIDGDYEFSGMIFSQKPNALDFSDPVTVLYGHNMKNGSMFADLHEFENADFFSEHDTFYIYIPEHILTYTVAAAYVYDDRHILNSYDFSKKKDLKEYINSIKNPHSVNCNINDNISITVKDNILTLSTCTSVDSQRYLVQGVLTDDQLTN